MTNSFLAMYPVAVKVGSCGSTNGEAISAQRFEESFKAGVFYNIDPRTGKRAKNKRR
jgi:hypothetical protein